MSLVVIALIPVNVLGGVDRLEHEFMACDRHLVFEYVLYMPYERFIRYLTVQNAELETNMGLCSVPTPHPTVITSSTGQIHLFIALSPAFSFHPPR